MNRLIFVLVLFLLTGSLAAGTQVNSAAAKKRLLGRHMLSLQWISWKRFGTAIVRERNGVLSLHGEQRGRSGAAANDYLKIDGTIVRVDRRSFVFDGTIVTRVHYLSGGEPCTRQGRMVFRISGKRRYWRLQQMASPCSHVTDYVDIYF